MDCALTAQMVQAATVGCVECADDVDGPQAAMISSGYLLECVRRHFTRGVGYRKGRDRYTRCWIQFNSVGTHGYQCTAGIRQT